MVYFLTFSFKLNFIFFLIRNQKSGNKPFVYSCFPLTQYDSQYSSNRVFEVFSNSGRFFQLGEVFPTRGDFSNSGRFLTWRWVFGLALVFCIPLGFLCPARFFVSRWVFEDLRTWGPFLSRFMSGGSNFSKGDFVSLGFFVSHWVFCGRTIKIDDTFGGVEKLYSVIEWSFKKLPSILKF